MSLFLKYLPKKNRRGRPLKKISIIPKITARNDSITQKLPTVIIHSETLIVLAYATDETRKNINVKIILVKGFPESIMCD